jgi:hypothetical protein
MTPPTIPGTLSPDRRTVRIRCPHCNQTHMHGAAGIADGQNNHRIAHCVGRPVPSPSYFVEVQPPGRRAVPA